MGRQVLSSVNAALRPMHSSSETNARFLCTPVLALSLACLLRAWRPQAPLRSLFLSPSLSVSVSLILSSLLLLHSVPVSVCMCVYTRTCVVCKFWLNLNRFFLTEASPIVREGPAEGESCSSSTEYFAKKLVKEPSTRGYAWCL